MSAEANPNKDRVALPAPTLWPGLLAVGLALLAAGLIGSAKLSWAGALIAFVAAIGWFRQVFPHEHVVEVPASAAPVVIATSRRKVAHMAEAPDRPHRARLPLQIYPISAGIKGGIAGGVAMAALAMLYGLVSHGSVWYPVNLLGSVVYAETGVSTAQLTAFHIELLVVAIILHVFFSILFGILYGALLPMLTRHPILVGGVFAPLVWSGLLYAILGNLDPILNQRMDWPWFLITQIAFGVVAGFVVLRQERVPTWQYPLAVRAGVEAPGIVDGEGGETAKR